MNTRFLKVSDLTAETQAAIERGDFTPLGNVTLKTAEIENDTLPESDDLDAVIAAPKRALTEAELDRMSAGIASGTIKETCGKCRGSGHFTSWGGRTLGQCFACKGKGFKEYKNNAATRASNREKVTARKADKKADQVAAFNAANPDVAAWLASNLSFDFAASMRAALEQWGSLTPRQLAACVTCMQKSAAAKEARAQREATAEAICTSKLDAAFAKASANGLQRLKLRFAGFAITPAKASSANAGALYVKADGGAYLGKIAGGKFIASRECTPERETEFRLAANDPTAAAIAYGKKLGKCSCCGAELSNPESIARGIGPICAANWGL